MTYQIAKSRVAALGYDFAAEVAKHVSRLEAHRFTGDAAPHSYPEVEAAIRRVSHPIEDQKPDDFIADYEIVNDDPPPPTLAERKAAAMADLRKQEQEEIAKLIAPEKRRLMDITYGRALRADPQTDADKKLIADRRAIDAQIEAIQLDYATREAALSEMT
jgi:hypothetical protein